MRYIFLVYFSSLFVFCQVSFAGGPLFVNDQGVASTWVVPTIIPYHPESGTCATFSNSDMLIKIQNNVALWSGISNIVLGFSPQAGQIGSVDSSNSDSFIALTNTATTASDGFNPIIFDDDGEIISALFGSSNKFFVLGFAGPAGFNDNLSLIDDGQAVFNCFCLPGNPTDTGNLCTSAGVTFTEDDLDFTMVHEFGHFLNLDHSQVNQALVSAGCSTTTSGDCDDVPTMFPQAVDPVDQISPHSDDIVAALTLYGDGTLNSSFCTVTGSLTDKNGTAMRCADVQAVTSDAGDTIAVVSGAFAPAQDLDGDGFTDGTSECISGCGDFSLKGLSAGLSYTITVKPIDPQFIGGSSVGPCGNAQITGIVAEDIASISGCTAGGTTVLGDIKTKSSLDSSSGSDNGASSGNCGKDQNFDDCSPLISCHLSTGATGATGATGENRFVLTFLFWANLILMLGFRQYFLKRDARYDKNSSL